MERRADGAVVLRGVSLHRGALASVTLQRATYDRVTIARAERGYAIDELVVAPSDRATRVVARSDDAARFATVEHLFAALAAFGIYGRFAIDVTTDDASGELPLLDGGARAWCEGIATLAIPPMTPRLRVVRDDVIDVGTSRYNFTSRDSVEVAVEIDFDDDRIARDASWSGDARDFHERIASARTFAFTRDLSELAARGLASHVAPESVVLVAPDVIHAAGAPFTPDEPARHKLLDLIGDLYLYGGPPRGRVHATRPGHAATHEAIRIARERGVVA